MAQIDPRDLDYSQEMRIYFGTLQRLLIEKHAKSPEQARETVERFFSMDVDPLERALVMHDDADSVAADLARL